jgi:hypothetical protein
LVLDRFLHVRQNRVRGVTTTPKNHQIRRIDMSAQLEIELQNLRRREREKHLAEGNELPAMVFASDTEGFLDVGNVRHAFYRILTAAARVITDFTIFATRSPAC